MFPTLSPYIRRPIAASQVHGTRFTDKYLQTRQTYSRNSYSSYSYSPPLPVRAYDRSIKRANPPSAVTPGSPPRKVVTDFASFGTRADASVFGTAVASTPFSLAGGQAAFGGIRERFSMFDADEEEDDEDKGRQRVELRDDTISFEQVPVKSSVHRVDC